MNLKRVLMLVFVFVVAALLFGAAPVHASDGAPIDAQGTVNAILPIVVAVMFAFVTGGATIAALLVLVLSMLLKSPVLLSVLEKLYTGLSPDWQSVITDAVAVGKEITDGIPAESKGLAG